MYNCIETVFYCTLVMVSILIFIITFTNSFIKLTNRSVNLNIEANGLYLDNCIQLHVLVLLIKM